MNKNVLKISLDVIMALLLILMYNKMAISLSFHELGGLILFGLFLIHKALDWKWIVEVSKKMFGKSIPLKTKFGYVINLLLFICVTVIIISGIMISETLFNGIARGDRASLRILHYFTSAVALVLCGIHIGLHWSFIKSMFAKVLRLPHVIARPLGILFLVAIIIYGGYSMVTSRFAAWLTTPFMQITGDVNFADILQEGQGKMRGQGNGTGLGQGLGIGDRRGGLGEHANAVSLNPAQIINLIVTYGSITTIFAVITWWIENLLKKMKQPKQIPSLA